MVHDSTVALCMKSHLFGVPIDGAADFSCDNNGVVKHTSISESSPKKKHNVIEYHVVCCTQVCSSRYTQGNKGRH